MSNEEFVAKNVVCMGVRLGAGKKLIMLGILNEANEIEKTSAYSLSRGVHMSVGQMYKGLSFSESTVRGLNRVMWIPGKWPDEGQRLQWEAEEELALTDFKHRKLEADATRVSEIQRIMAPLRKQYAALRARYDMNSCAVLEQAVKQALMTPIRKSEE